VIEHTERDGVVSFTVRVVPRASRSEIAGEQEGVLRVRVAAPPVDGAANEELVRLLSRALRVARSSIEISSGAHSKTKRVRIRGLSGARLEALIAKIS